MTLNFEQPHCDLNLNIATLDRLAPSGCNWQN